jgi:hypothetical protein
MTADRIVTNLVKGQFLQNQLHLSHSIHIRAILQSLVLKINFTFWIG